VLAVLRVARKRSTRDWCALLLCYSHGMRAQEVCNLTTRDVDLKGGQITIRRLKGSLHTVQQLMPHRGEPLLDEVKALKEWYAIRPEYSGDALFVSQKGGHLNLARVKQFLGHSAISSTMRYVSVSDQEASHDAANALMNAF